MNGTTQAVASLNETEPGVIRMISGRLVDLRNLKEEDIHLEDIAWGLGRILRYNGHIRQDYTVAHHSIIMSYYVPEPFKLEALFHDAAESYTGDIIRPVKRMFPEVSWFEDEVLAKILNRFNIPHERRLSIQSEGATGPVYKKSKTVADADADLYAHECFSLGRPGIYVPEVEAAWLEAAEQHGTYWYAGQYAFIERFEQLTNVPESERLVPESGLINPKLTAQWFPDEVPDADDVIITSEEEVEDG